MLDVRRLRLLRELAQRGTITAVAQALSFTPSAVSQQLSALEREAGLPLLGRSGRRGVPSPGPSRTMTPAALVALGRQHPGLQPMVCELDRARVAGALRAGELD